MEFEELKFTDFSKYKKSEQIVDSIGIMGKNSITKCRQKVTPGKNHKSGKVGSKILGVGMGLLITFLIYAVICGVISRDRIDKDYSNLISESGVVSVEDIPTAQTRWAAFIEEVKDPKDVAKVISDYFMIKDLGQALIDRITGNDIRKGLNR